MELSSFEIMRLVSEMRIGRGYYVSNVYQVGDGSLLLKLHHPDLPNLALILSCKGFWITKYNVGRVERGRFLKSLRRWILRSRFEGARQIGSERIVEFTLEGSSGRLYMMLELFGSGNLLLLDGSKQILDCLKEVRVRGRSLVKGSTYALPKARGADLRTVKEEMILKVRESEDEVSRWIGRALGLPRRYTEELLYRAGVDPRVKGKELEEKDCRLLYERLKEMVLLARSRGEAYAYFEDFEFELSPFELESMGGKRVERFKGMMEALDELLARGMAKSKEEERFKPLKAKLRSIDRAIRGKKRAIGTLERKVKALFILAERLKSRYISGMGREEALTSLGAKRMPDGAFSLEIEGEKFRFGSESLMGMASKVYNRAKRLKTSLSDLRTSIEPLEDRRRDVLKKLERGELKLRPPKPVRRKRWFERYRWFVTSEGCLVIGGRDASSNVSLIRKHVENGDLVFHADIHGSPFFVLKGCKSDVSIRETALATVCFSRAWREGYGYGDAYWVEPDQVRLSAPSGMYLPKGGLLITGKKNFIKGMKLVLAIGICKLDGDLIPIAGPKSAVKKYGLAYVELVPFKGKVSESTKLVRRMLAPILGEEVSRIGLDEFIAVMPGPGKPFSPGKGEGIDLGKVIIGTRDVKMDGDGRG